MGVVAPVGLSGRDFLRISDLSSAEAAQILDLAGQLRTNPKEPLFPGATLGLYPGAKRASANADVSVPFHDAKSQLIDAWEHDYITRLLDKHGGNLSLAARTAGMSRMQLYRLLEKHRVANK